MKPQDQLLDRYHQAKAHLPNELPNEPSSALHERIMQAAREQAITTNSIASRADSMPATSPKEYKKTPPTTDAANDSFWSIKAVASIAVMGLSALIWWQFEQGTPQEQEAAKTALPRPAVVAITPTTAPTTAPSTAPATAAPNEARAESPRSEKNVIAPAPQPVPAPAAQEAAKPTPSLAPQVAAQRSRTQDMATAPIDAATPQTANAEAAIKAETAERSATAKSTSPTPASKQFSAEAQGTLSAPPVAAAPPPMTSPAARAAAAPMAVARPPLLVALQARDAAALRKALAQGASPNLRTPDGNPALTQAVTQRWPEGVRILLASGADRLAKNNKGHTAADVALELSFDDMTELLATPR